MPRPRLRRNINFDPNVYYFKPQGVPMRSLGEIILNSDEIEALKLHDYDGFDQNFSSEKMGISQPTFGRILDSAYKKITKALVEGLAIKIQEE